MGRYNLVQLEDIYFTDNGLSSGKPCKVKVLGLNGLLLNKGGVTIISANGTPWNQLVDVEKRGIQINFSFDFIEKSVSDDIISEINDALDNQLNKVLNISGDLGDFSLTVKPFMPDTVKGGEEFSNGIIKNITYSFITT